MKKLVFSFIMLMCHTVVYAQTVAHIMVENNSGKEVSLQPEESERYESVEGKSAVREVMASMPCYYRLVCGDDFYSVFVTPGADIKVKCSADGVEFSGTNKAENDFMRANKFFCRAPGDVKMYSKEWIEYNEGELKRLYSLLETSGLSPEFIAVHKLYLEYIYLNQRLNGVQVSMAFGHGKGGKVELADGFYDFLADLKFDDWRILSVPKWFKVVDNAMEEMEKHGFMEVSNDHYVKNHAMRIADGRVRSRYIVELLRLVLKKGYFDDFMAHFDEVSPMVTDSAAASELHDIQSQYVKVRESNLGISRGTLMPDFTAQTLDGKVVHLSDFKDKILIIDFWFTGCVPCKAEMPYFDKLAKELAGKDVKFISVSLDTGEQLLAAWRKIVAAKEPSSEVVYLNLNGGFKSGFVKEMNIRSVPRIMMVGKDGRIIDTYAKKPSDPKLKQQIEQLLL